ncbi:MAG: PAS domain S-box protein [Spirochaetes bacterium]|nr:PAS domain S-box protein [Spirochaetota bacterium]
MDIKKCILLVEDEALIAEAESATLQRHGYDVITVSDGESAIECCKEEIQIDMILMDIDLGDGMDGPEAAVMILQDHDIPLVFLSSHIEKEVVDKTREITNYGYILKSAGETVLTASIDMAFKLYEAHLRLRESESRYRLLADNSRDVIWTMDISGEFTYVSPSVFHLSGWTPEEAYQMTYEDYILPQYVSMFKAELIHELSLPPEKRSKTKYLNFKQYKKDGTIINVESNLAWIFDKDGNPIGIQGSNRDISYRSWMEEALRDSNAKYQVIIENLDIIIYVLNRDGVAMYISPNVKKFGYSEDDILGHSMMEFIHPDDHALVLDSLRRVLDKGEEFPLELRMVRKNGDLVWVFEIGNILRDENNNFAQLVGCMLDITQHKQAEVALRESERRYRLLADNSTDVIWTMDLNGHFTYISPSVEKMTGWTQEESIGMELDDYVLPEYVDFIRKEIANELSKPAAERTPSKMIEIQQYAKDGSILFDEITVTWIYDEKGKITGLQGSNRYINDRKRIEENLHRALKEKETLLHELQYRVKNSMSIINGLVSLETDLLRDPHAQEALKNIRNRIQSMAALYDLLFQSNEIREIRLDRYIDKMGRMLLDTYTGEKRRFVIESRLDELRIDTKRAISIGLILNELLMNAVKHGRDKTGESTIRLDLKNEEEKAVIEVANKDSVFPKDFNPETSQGMGLKIVSMLTAQLKGSLEFQNSGNALFRIIFPL